MNASRGITRRSTRHSVMERAAGARLLLPRRRVLRPGGDTATRASNGSPEATTVSLRPVAVACLLCASWDSAYSVWGLLGEGSSGANCGRHAAGRHAVCSIILLQHTKLPFEPVRVGTASLATWELPVPPSRSVIEYEALLVSVDDLCRRADSLRGHGGGIDDEN